MGTRDHVEVVVADELACLLAAAAAQRETVPVELKPAGVDRAVRLALPDDRVARDERNDAASSGGSNQNSRSVTLKRGISLS